ncbi:MAG: ABC transporter ATP-binding protein [Anaerolineaceae bacterium]|nr:ABC transporter ATP-binding protein [Anaerolineaceae bacterium]
MTGQIILKIENLHKHFPAPRSITDNLMRRSKQIIRAVDGVSFSIGLGEIIALVGESGSGKTTVGMNVLGLQVPTHGRVLFDGNDIALWSRGKLETSAEKEAGIGQFSRRKQILELRRRVQMVFQDPYESLNPRQTIFEIVSEPLEIHFSGQTLQEKEARVRTALEDSGLFPADHFWSRYPEELSGGQRQRVVIAGALVLEPELLVADEPVSMLDVSIRAEILNLMRNLVQQRDMTILYTTHDLATAGYFTDRMAVMYLGRIVELGDTKKVLTHPQHPYTRALVSVAPVPNPRKRRTRVILQGEVPNPMDIPPGCRFHPRCPVAFDTCREVDPPSIEVSPGHQAACLLLA